MRKYEEKSLKIILDNGTAKSQEVTDILTISRGNLPTVLHENLDMIGIMSFRKRLSVAHLIKLLARETYQ